MEIDLKRQEQLYTIIQNQISSLSILITNIVSMVGNLLYQKKNYLNENS